MNSRPIIPVLTSHRGLRRRSGVSKQQHIRTRIKKHLRFLLSIGAIGIVMILSKVIIDVTLFAPINTIKTIVIDPQTIQQIQDPGLYAQIQNILSGHNVYLAQRRNKADILQQLQTIEPFIQSVTISKVKDTVALISINFRQPDILIINGIERSVRIDEHHIILSSGDQRGNTAPIIYLPSYLSGAAYTTGLFFELSPKKLSELVTTIQTAVPEYQRMIWFPGGRRILIETSDRKRVFVSIYKDLAQQFYKWDLLKSSYSQYQQLQQIDLGSQETLIIR